MMDDLISRQAAIDAIIEDKICDDSLKILIALGSGDKAETLNMTCNRHVKMLMSLPSAQPEERTKKRTETHTCDCISRKDAIRWIKTECNPYGKPTLDFESGKRVMKHLEQMPPAQPEYEPVTAEDFAKTMSETTVYSYMVWHSEALTLMKKQGFVVCKKTI